MKRLSILILCISSIYGMSPENKAFFESLKKSNTNKYQIDNVKDGISAKDRAFFKSLKNAKRNVEQNTNKYQIDYMTNRKHNKEKCVDKGIEIFFEKKSLTRLESTSVSIIEHSILNQNQEVDISKETFDKYFFNCVPSGEPRSSGSFREDGVHTTQRHKEYCLQPLRKGQIVIDNSFFINLPKNYSCLPQTLKISARKYTSFNHNRNNYAPTSNPKTQPRKAKLEAIAFQVNKLKQECNPNNESFGFIVPKKYKKSFDSLDMVLINYEEKLSNEKDQKIKEKIKMDINYIQKRIKLTHEYVKIQEYCKNKKTLKDPPSPLLLHQQKD